MLQNGATFKKGILSYFAVLFLIIMFVPSAFIYMTFLWFILFNIVVIYTLVSERKYEGNLEDDKQYSRDIPAINPLISGCIEGKRKPRIDDIMATILDLVNRKYLLMRVVDGKYLMSINKEQKFEELFEYEQGILKLLFDSRDNDKELDLYESIKEIRSSFEKRKVIKLIYEMAYEKVREYYTNYGSKCQNAIGFVFLTNFATIFISLMMGGRLMHYIPSDWNMNILIIMLVALYAYIFVVAIFTSNKMVLKDEFISTRKQLKSFKHYLENFSSFKDDEIKEVKLYDSYFIYSLAFGIAKKAEKELKQDYIDSDISDLFHTLQADNFFEID